MRYFNKKHIFLKACILLLVFSLAGCGILSEGKINESVTPKNSENISAFGWVGITFSREVIRETAEDAFSISPETPGEIFFHGNTLWFRPLQAFNKDIEYLVHVEGEIEAINGQLISVDHTWNFTIREPELVYFVPSEEGGEIWRASADGNEKMQLSFTDNKLIEFSPDPTGTTIAFTVQNDSGGHDLWLMDREGEDQRLLLNCEKDICSEPAWSMDRQTIAFTRELYQERTNTYLTSQIWTVDIETGSTAQLYQSDWAFGNSPSFSPDGKHFASYDTTNRGIRILDLETSQESIIPSALPGSGDWSPDGTKIIFTDLVPAENEPFVQVFVLDLETNAVDTALDAGLSDTDFSQPRWSPEGESVAVSLRPVNANISKALWVLRLDGLVNRQITDDPSATFTAYEWDPWGDRLIYQRYDLTSTETSIWLWESGENKMIIENSSRPKWLP
ncbi:MAG: hypothetical protein RQ728_07870 [Brevefilum sp.]|nr:hypothetical protein [Brevefilum sp.]MDW7755604.1 hypothetical protein [Brevefilum sp.]